MYNLRKRIRAVNAYGGAVRYQLLIGLYAYVQPFEEGVELKVLKEHCQGIIVIFAHCGALYVKIYGNITVYGA